MSEIKETPYYLYKITNNVNGKLYIGVTRNLQQRFKYHKINRSKKVISLIAQAIDKYGADNFTFETICIGSKDYIFQLEAEVIKAYETQSPKGYNLHPGGEGGVGHEVKKRSDDKPIFVSGFWFPNLRTASKALPIKRRTIQDRLKRGVAGDVVQKSNSYTDSQSDFVYVGGFWFPCLRQASESLKVRLVTLRKRLYKGFLEAERPKMKSGDSHASFGRKGINAKPISIFGICYPSQVIASEKTGLSKDYIYRKLKEGHPDFKFIKEELNSG